MTKKQLVPLSGTTGTMIRGCFVSPVLDRDGGVRYVSMPGDVTISRATCVFTGVDVDAGEFLARYRSSGLIEDAPAEELERLFTEYLDTVRAIKIGTTVTLLPDRTGAIRLELDL